MYVLSKNLIYIYFFLTKYALKLVWFTEEVDTGNKTSFIKQKWFLGKILVAFFVSKQNSLSKKKLYRTILVYK